jgi:LPXTG-motif cell wall-anchored protein
MGNTLAQTESLPNGTQPATEPITQTGNGDQPIVPAQDSTILFLLAGILVIVIIAVLVMRYKKKVY